MTHQVDARAHFEGRSLGSGSRVHAFVRATPDVEVGDNCVLHDQAQLLGRITLDDDVVIGSAAQLLGSVHAESGVVVGAGAVLGEEDRDGGREGDEIVVRRLASVGANATIAPGVVIGRHAVVRPGSVVGENVPANAIVGGNPARIVAYADTPGEPAQRDGTPVRNDEPAGATSVRGVTLHRMTHARDLRGSLMVAEFGALPFAPQRAFTVYDVPNESVRGAHAHRVCAQLLVCLAGGVSCLVDDGSARDEIRLDGPTVGLHIPAMIWGTQWKYTRDAVLLAFASHPYDSADYIREYEEYLALL
jgi:UDP-2-acetamido-3-amino-2,3-dideoxy-glucuronate N-acetyltransferase